MPAGLLFLHEPGTMQVRENEKESAAVFSGTLASITVYDDKYEIYKAVFKVDRAWTNIQSQKGQPILLI